MVTMKISWKCCIFTIAAIDFVNSVDSFSFITENSSKHVSSSQTKLYAFDHSSTYTQGDEHNESGHDSGSTSSTRRSIVLSSLPFATILSGGYPFRSEEAKAGLVQFPCPHLMNTYHFMRAGQSLLEEQDIWSTNPLFLTNRENALSDLGKDQVRSAIAYFEENNVNPSLVKFSLAANAIDTADMISTDMQVGRNRLVPEYTYLDQRGLGKWEGLPQSSTQDAVWAMDAEEAGVDGLGGKPPPNDDGTPNETLSNQVTRLRQLFSLLESTMSGDTIILIFPDATGPAVLSALIAGVPLNRVHELSFQPGEVRLDITFDSVRSQLPSRPSAAYTEALARGKGQLRVLRTNPEDIISVKDKEKEDALALAKEKEVALALEKEKKRAEKEKTIREEHERQEARRTQEMHLREAARQKKREEISAEREHDLTGMDIFSVGAMGIAAALLSWKDGNRDDTEIASEVLMKNVTSVDLPLSTTAKSNQEDISTEKYPELQAIEDMAADEEISHKLTTGIQSDTPGIPAELKTMENMIQVAPIGIPEFPSPENVEKNKFELAEQAMEAYMDQDDGGEDWLGSLAEIIAEEEL